jgi:hypothetical protein
MKKLALAIGLGAYVVFGASSGSLAAYRIDNPNGVAAAARIPWSESGTNVHLLFLNERLYPDVAATRSPGDFGNQERAEATQRSASATDTQRMACDGDICLVP